MAIKRILDERDLLIERHDREPEREEPSDDAYDAFTGDEDTRLEDAELPDQENGPLGDVEGATSEGHMSDDNADAPSGHDGSVDAPIDGGNDDGPSSVLESGQPEQREGPTVSATGWCNGDVERIDGSMTTRVAEALGQMPHGRWQSHVASGVPTGTVYTGAAPWAAQVFRRDDGVHIGMTSFRLSAAVYDGTSEELAQRLIAMLEGTRMK